MNLSEGMQTDRGKHAFSLEQRVILSFIALCSQVVLLQSAGIPCVIVYGTVVVKDSKVLKEFFPGMAIHTSQKSKTQQEGKLVSPPVGNKPEENENADQ